MRHLLMTLLGASFITMSTAATSDTGSTLLLETTKARWRSSSSDLANHVARITELANSGFYDGIIFHRVIPGFMAQTGDPQGTGMGGSGQDLDAEFTDYEYKVGTVGMARSMNPNSGDSQFFICFEVWSPYRAIHRLGAGRTRDGKCLQHHAWRATRITRPDRVSARHRLTRCGCGC